METRLKREGGLILRHSPLGIGYEAVDSEDGYKRLYYTSSSKQLDRLGKHMERGGKIETFSEEPESDFEPRMLVLYEKHGDFRVLIRTEDQLFEAALRIVKARNKEGWYRRFVEPPKRPDFTKEDLAIIPASLRPQAEKELREFESEEREWRQQKKQVDRLERALKENNGRQAWIFLQFLQSQGEAQYERVELDSFAKIEQLGPKD